MKKIALLLFVIISGLCFSQIVELKKLSTGKLADASVLYDRNNDDVYGYFYIFEKDKVSKTEYSYEYVLLDKNLNKVCSGEFKENLSFTKSYGQWYFSFSSVYRNGFISIGMIMKPNWYFIPSKYRLLDVKENKLSDAFTLLPDLTKKYNPEPPTKTKDVVYFNYYPNPFGYTIDTPFKSAKEDGTYLYTKNANQ